LVDRRRALARVGQARRRARRHGATLGSALVRRAVLALRSAIVGDAADDVPGDARLARREVDDQHVVAVGVADTDRLPARVEAGSEGVTAGRRAEAPLAATAAGGDDVADVHAADDHLERRLWIQLVDLEDEPSVVLRLERERRLSARVGIDSR